MNGDRLKRPLALLLALAVAGGLTLLAGLGALKGPDLAACDALYQQPMLVDGDILLIGADQRSLEELGPYSQWGRGVMARAIEILNAQEDSRPAVIALDFLYAGESDPEQDLRLTRAAAEGGNVIAACAAEFGTAMVPYLDDFALQGHSILSFDRPYEALAEAAAQGHINAMLDGDGILRHHLLSITLEDGTQVPSLALAAADRYRAARGEGPVDRPPTDAHGFWYVSFCGGPRQFGIPVSLAELLTGELDSARYAGKIVLIGPYAAGLQDSYFTAADHAEPMFGVEFQANAIQALLRGDYKTEVKDSLQLAALFLLLLAALAGFWHRPLKWAVPLWVLLCGGWVGLCWGLYQLGWVLHVLWVPAGVTVLFAGCLAANYLQAALERQRVTNTFKKYVDGEIVRELLKQGPEALSLEGRLTRVAVLFVDVRGFTPMSEKLEPGEVVAILNRYLTLISDCILNNKGTLDKFVGDAAMAFWGAPLPQEDYVMRAARAAMDMVEGSQALSEELLARYGRTVSFGIGIHVGEAVIGNIGSLKRMDYTAIGDTVNTAARLEANAPAGTIYISRAVADELEGRIRATSLGDSIKLKGKSEGFEVLTLDELL